MHLILTIIVSYIASKACTGRVINIASVAGQVGHPGGANYAAAKGGVLALTMSYAKEFSALGITVNAICPGLIDSDVTRELPPELLVRKACCSLSYDKIAFNFLTNVNLSHSLVIATHTCILYTFQKIFLEGVPLKRIGKPEEVAGMCRFLALDPAADCITGHVFNVDGGLVIGC